MRARRKGPPFLQRVEKKFAGMEEGSTVPAKREKGVCGHVGRVHRSCKERKRGLQARRKDPLFLQREKKRFAGTEEVASVPAKSEKEVCRNGGSSPHSWKGQKRGLQERRKSPRSWKQ
ncbi:hypothetical protein QA612_10830 [Evansella sp. AB-P1]|uniref:hypothetical protein n=1 Tax=Evansella sp. AB-P1 TaxID=3037653 RepID=UPI0024204453|nr:hypothetical protein [Evansella sp. AB-P1]MDG5787983.1 hypothetical protein [Evansella sp. AB-P1]